MKQCFHYFETVNNVLAGRGKCKSEIGPFKCGIGLQISELFMMVGAHRVRPYVWQASLEPQTPASVLQDPKFR